MNAAPTGRELAVGIGRRLQRLELTVARYRLALVLTLVAAALGLAARFT